MYKYVSRLFLLLFIPVLINSCGQNQLKVADENAALNDTTNAVVNVEPKNDLTSYEILGTQHNNAVQNFHILLKGVKKDEASLQEFVNRFRNEFCSRKCNISLYDDKRIRHLVTKYPLKDKEYLAVADHFVASSSFDMTDIWLYPFQDLKYKQLGGKNWKKEPFK